MGSFGGCVLAAGCEQGGAKNQAQEGYCRLPIADCRLPIADCRLPIADCRLPIADCRLPIADSTATAFAVKLVWLVCVMSFPLVLCQWLLPPTKAIIHTKNLFSSFPPPLRGENDGNGFGFPLLWGWLLLFGENAFYFFKP